MEKELKFKTDQGIFYTKGLFFETTLADKSTVLYTLKNEDHEGYPSLYRLYMEQADLTEWEFANKHLGGWDHWQKICECNWFKEYIQRWREELELSIRAAALRRIQAEARSSSRNAYTANKFLVDAGWKPKEEKKDSVGRPSKEAIRKKAIELVQDEELLQEDFKRLNLN